MKLIFFNPNHNNNCNINQTLKGESLSTLDNKKKSQNKNIESHTASLSSRKCWVWALNWAAHDGVAIPIYIR